MTAGAPFELEELVVTANAGERTVLVVTPAMKVRIGRERAME